MTIEELKKLPVKELKAMAYDQLATLEQAQKNLQILNQLITEKNQQPVAQPSLKDAPKTVKTEKPKA